MSSALRHCLITRSQTLPRNEDETQLLEKAVLLRPDHVPYYNNLAKAYFLADLPDLAVATYEESLRRDSSNATARKNLQLLTMAARSGDADLTSRQGIETLNGAAVATMKPPIILAQLQEARDDTQAPPDTIEALQVQAARDDMEAQTLRELLRDLPTVTVERRAGRLPSPAGRAAHTNGRCWIGYSATLRRHRTRSRLHRPVSRRRQPPSAWCRKSWT